MMMNEGFAFAAIAPMVLCLLRMMVRLVSPVGFRAEFMHLTPFRTPAQGRTGRSRGFTGNGNPKNTARVTSLSGACVVQATDKRDEESPTIRKAIQQTFITKKST